MFAMNHELVSFGDLDETRAARYGARPGRRGRREAGSRLIPLVLNAAGLSRIDFATR